jgi:hypothetical protein
VPPVKPLAAALTGTAVAYTLVILVVVRLVVGRILSSAGIPLFDAVASLLIGGLSLGFLNPAGVPVIGLAFAAAGLLRESREGKRGFVFILLGIAIVLCAYATFISLRHTGDNYQP